MRMGTGRTQSAVAAVIVSGWLLASVLTAQMISGPMVAQDQTAWQRWKVAMDQINRGQWSQADAALKDVNGMDLSALRLALMAGRTGTQLMEMGVKNKQLAQAAVDLLAKIETGNRQMKLVTDGWHFAAIGKFEMADANFQAFLASGPDPVAALELAELNANRQAILVRLISNTQVGPAANAVLDLLGRGEKMIRTDPRRIRANIERLGGSPQAVYNATGQLIESGEYAVPYLVDYLQDPEKRSLHAAIITCLPQLGRSAVGPLCIALRTERAATRQLILEALGKIGYAQALPYIKGLLENQKTTDQVMMAAQAALLQIETTSGRAVGQKDAAALFGELAEQYYYARGSIQADPREDIANVWYWQGGRLVNVEVPREIFNEIMCMRCCEEALGLRAEFPEAIALWLAANFRREAQLEVASVDSEAGDPALAADRTKTADYPRAIYFGRTAGAKYAHLMLARGVKDRDPAVALGAVSALASTAGANNLVGVEDIKQPLVETLSFPDPLIRIRAALALGAALPPSRFAGCPRVVPVLAEALLLTGQKNALVVDPDEQNLNRVVGLLRAQDVTVVGQKNLLAGLNKARDELSLVDVIYVASDIDQPSLGQALSEIRKDFVFAATPVVVLAKPQQTLLSRRFAAADERVARVLSEAGIEQLLEAWQRVARTAGRAELTKELAFELSMQAAGVLRMIAFSNSQVYDFAVAEPALIDVLANGDERLRKEAAGVLALSRSATAQRSIAELALDEKASKELRLAAFGSLAESARAHGCLLDEEPIDGLIEVVMQAEDLTIRTAASAALGALDLPGNKASQTIRAQYRG